MAKLPLVGLIRLVHCEPYLSGNLFLLLWVSFGIAKWHDNCPSYIISYGLNGGEVLMFILLLVFDSKCLGCVYVQRESKSSDFKGVSGTLIVSVYTLYTIIWCMVKI